MNNEWITDRLPTEEDADHYGFVWNSEGVRRSWMDIKPHEPWMRTNRPKPYVKPGRFRVVEQLNTFTVNEGNDPIAISIPTREAAQRIADIYNEVTT